MKMMLTSAKLTRKKKKVSFHALIKLNTKQRRQMSNCTMSCQVYSSNINFN
jgi:hypothetical protein